MAIPCPDPCPVFTNDLTITQGKGLIITAPDGTTWFLSVADNGALVTTPYP